MIFDTVIAPWTADRFWDEVWERQPLHIARQQPDFYQGLASAAAVAALLFQGPGLPPATVRLYRGEEQCDGGGPAHLDAHYRQGYNILVSQIAEQLPTVAALLAALADAYKTKCLAHLMVSPPGANGFAPHSDAYGVFALQIAGAKRWSIYETIPRSTVNQGVNRHELIRPATAAAPHVRRSLVGGCPRPASEVLESSDHRSELSSTDMSQTPATRQVVMRAGDLLYLPRGTVHAAAALEEASIHLVVAMIPPRGADLLHLLATAAEEDAFFRDYIPYGIGESAPRRGDYLQAFSARLTHLLTTTDLYALLDARQGQRTRRQPSEG